MALFKNMLRDNESVFMDPIALDYDYVPELMPYREKEQFAIAACIKPLFSQRTGKNIFVHGKPGIGKTLAIKHILQELEEQTDDILPLYVNCWQKNTTYKVLVEICELIGYRFTQNKRTEELLKVVKEILNKKAVVFVFDEVDKTEELDVLYTLMEQIYRKSIIMITNFKSWLDDLDIRVKSRLTPEMIEFKPYSAEETKGILKNRVQYAFQPASLAADAFDLVVDRTVTMQDIRSGLYLLREAGNATEERSSKMIELVDVQIAIKKLDEFTIKSADDLDDEAKMILGLAKKNSTIKIGDLFKQYETTGGKLTYKTFQRKIEKLDEGKFITTEKIAGGKDGKTTMIRSSTEKKLSDF